MASAAGDSKTDDVKGTKTEEVTKPPFTFRSFADEKLSKSGVYNNPIDPEKNDWTDSCTTYFGDHIDPPEMKKALSQKLSLLVPAIASKIKRKVTQLLTDADLEAVAKRYAGLTNEILVFKTKTMTTVYIAGFVYNGDKEWVAAVTY